MNVHDFLNYRMEKTAGPRFSAFKRGFRRGAGRAAGRGAAVGGVVGGVVDGGMSHMLKGVPGMSSVPAAAGRGALVGGAAGAGIASLANGIFQGVKEMRKRGVKPTPAKVKAVGMRIMGRPVSNKELVAAGVLTSAGALTAVGMGMRKPKK